MSPTNQTEPCYAVIFTSIRNEDDPEYDAMAEKMLALAKQEPGFLGVDSVRQDRLGITVSYWRSQEDIQRWRQHVDHRQARKLGHQRWYADFDLKVCKVIRSQRGGTNPRLLESET